jgi:translation initiation factor 4G
MTSAASPSANQTSASAASTTSGSSTPQSGAVPAQLPVRSYASATKTASSTPPAAAGASAPNAKSTESSVNGSGPTAQGGSQPATNGVSDHGRKPSMVISATGSSGYTQNGGPVSQTSRPPINFGSMNAPEGAQSNTAQQSQTAAAPAAQEGNRVIEADHSPSPIPQPTASGGRPPSIAQTQGNGLNFGSMGGDASNQGQSTLNAAGQPSHERRASNNSYNSDMGPRPNFVPQAGRGRGGYQSGPYNNNNNNNMPSPAQNYRQMSNQGQRAPNMAQQFSQGPQGSPYNRGRNSPAQLPAQPHMPQMQYQGYPQHLGAAPPMYPNMPNQFDPHAGYYNPFPPYNYQYPGQAPPQSPRPQYPNAYTGTPGNNQPPFMPPNMAREPSQTSERPSSSVGHASTPSQSHAQTASTPTQQTPQQGSNFVRPVKKSSAIKITNDRGEAVSFQKPSPSPSTQQPQGPVIVSSPNVPNAASAPTPPPRAPSAQHTRTESTSTMSVQERQNAFQEQIRKKMEEEKRKEAESQSKDAPAATPAAESSPAVESAPATEEPASKPAAETEVKAAAADAEKAAAIAAEDKQGEKDAAAAAAAVKTEETEKKPEEKSEEKPEEKEETEDERLEREIAEMEALEKEEEEREKAYSAKKKAEKEAADKVKAAKADEELKRQEREAEELELKRERERNGDSEKKDDDDEEAKALFASLKKPTLGPGATEEAETSAPAEPTPVANAAQAAQKPKPAHLKLETNKRVEPAEPTPGMQALKSSRFLSVKEELSYPEGVKSPNPALNQKEGRAYDKDFLLQFQSVFKEKPTVDWDQKVKDTLGGGDEPGSARAGTPRGGGSSMGSRSASGRGGASSAFGGGAMGSFGGGARTLPTGTTSEQRFAAANSGGARASGPGAMGARMPSNLGMGGPGSMGARANSSMGPNSPRQPSGRGGRGGASRRGDRAPSKREMDDAASKMPLTAGMDLKPIEKSANGWVARSLAPGTSNAPVLDASGNMAPDMVQRKVKAALNKMTPEKFDKISEQVLEIAAQSKNEADGRTLRQVIQLTFEKACDEAHWAGMYAKFCHKMLTTMSLEIRDETIKDRNGNPVVGGALFRKYLLNRCQEEFERGWEANLPDKPEGEESEIKLMSDEYYVAAAAKRKGLGLIQFIGQLYKLGMLTIRIMHECVQRLLNFEGDPDESAIENLTTLLRSVGPTMYDSGDQGQALLNAYFERIHEKITSNAALASRPRFMVMDLIDLKNAGWRGKDDTKGPKTITQIHAEAEAANAKAEAERQRTRAPGGRQMGGRGDSRNFSNNMAPPVDYSRTHVGADELRRLQSRTTSRNTGGGLGPGGNLGPGGGLGGRAGSRRGNLGPNGSGPTTRTNTPPVDNKKDEPAQQNAFR